MDLRRAWYCFIGRSFRRPGGTNIERAQLNSKLRKSETFLANNFAASEQLGEFSWLLINTLRPGTRQRSSTLRNLLHGFDQSLNFFIAGVASTSNAHQTFRLQAQSIDHCPGIEISVRNEQTFFR